MKAKAVALGSCHAIFCFVADRLPLEGESILGTSLRKFCAGKGANVAIMSRKLGCDVVLIERMGDDEYGRAEKEKYEALGIDHRFAFLDGEVPSGMCGSFLCDSETNHENSYIVIPNANYRLSTVDIDMAEKEISQACVLSAQLEVPVATVKYAMKLASKYGVRTILDLAPAQSLDDETYRYISIIKPNEFEAALLTGIKVKDVDSAFATGRWFIGRGVKEAAIITLGEKGCVCVTKEKENYYPSIPVKAIVAGGAGDMFCAGLVRATTLGYSIDSMIKYAQVLAVLKVKLGHGRFPSEEEIVKMYIDNYGYPDLWDHG